LLRAGSSRISRALTRTGAAQQPFLMRLIPSGSMYVGFLHGLGGGGRGGTGLVLWAGGFSAVPLSSGVLFSVAPVETGSPSPAPVGTAPTVPSPVGTDGTVFGGSARSTSTTGGFSVSAGGVVGTTTGSPP